MHAESPSIPNGPAVLGPAHLSADDAWDQAYKEAITADVPHQVSWLLDTIGARFTAAAVGLGDARTLRRWRDGSTAPRDHLEQDRLQLLYRIARAITLVYDRPSVAASFLRSANPQLDDQAPLMLLAGGDTAEVQRQLLSATRAFLEG
jgi:hypothetical protein